MLLYINFKRGGDIMEHLISKKNKKTKRTIHTGIACEEWNCMNTCSGYCVGALWKIKID